MPGGDPEPQRPRAPKPVALVTGGAVRVGRAVAVRLARGGYDVAITYRGSKAEAEATVRALQDAGAEAVALQAEFADLAAVSMLPARASEAMTRLDLVVNSASVFYRSPVGGVAEEEWDHLFAINVKAPFFLAQAAIPYLKHENPCIINVLDAGTTRPFPGYIPYIASKAALEAVTLGLARALAPRIRVNGVAPGPVLPPADYDDEARDKAARTTLLGRWGTPDDVAAAVAYLAGARYATGVVLPVDGGRRTK